MTIRWEELKAAEKGWRLDGRKREAILRYCLGGQKVHHFSWRYVGIPAAYLGVTAAVFLLMLFMWPHFKSPKEENIIIIDGATAQPEKPVENPTPSGDQPNDEPPQVPPAQGEQEQQPQTQPPAEEDPRQDPEEEPKQNQADNKQSEAEPPVKQPTEEKQPEAEDPAEEKQPEEQPKGSMVQRVEYNQSEALERLTVGALENQFGYDIYYCGIKAFYIQVDGETIELREALAKDPKVLDQLYAEWKKDHGNKYIFYDGGTIEYPYETYTAIKLNAFRTFHEAEPYRDLVLCAPGKDLDEVTALMKDMYAHYTVDPKLHSVIRQIEKDYAKAKNISEGSYVVGLYFGNYDGAVPVVMRSKDSQGVKIDENYSEMEILIWKNGAIYSVNDALKNKILTNEQFSIVLDVFEKGNYIKMDGFEDTLHTPPEELLEQIKEYYLEWETESDDEFRLYYYGTYSGVAVVDFGSLVTVSLPEIYKPDNLETNTPEVAKIYHLRAWVDGELIPIQHAYVRGALSKEQVQKIESVFVNKTMLCFKFE